MFVSDRIRVKNESFGLKAMYSVNLKANYDVTSLSVVSFWLPVNLVKDVGQQKTP